jgi:spore coat protein H
MTHRLTIPMLLAAGLLVVAGCPGETADDVPDDDAADDDDDAADGDGPDYALELYDPDHVVEVHIEIDEDDAAALAAETTSILDLVTGEDCLAEPLGMTFTWFHCDVTVDGTTVTDVGVRKKGLIGSLSESKPGLKLKFDKWVEGQLLDDVERLTLNNSVSDPTLVRQCIGYQLFRDAGLAAPRCNFAHVTVNEIDLGVYVNVEPVKKDFLRWAYGDEDGDLYEGTLSDFRPEWVGTFDAKTSDTDPDNGPIWDVVEALEADDDELVDALDEVLDVDSYLTFWAMEVLVAHMDGYAGNTNNYFVYRDPDTDLITFMPWGIDAIFWNYDGWGFDTQDAVLANGYLANRFFDHPELKVLYLERLESLLDEVWDEDAILDEIDRMEVLVAPYALHDPWMEPMLEDLRDFVLARRATLEASLDEGPTWDLPLADSPCLIPSGTMEATFDTTWGTLETPDPLGTGAGTVDGVWDGADMPHVSGGAIAGQSSGSAMIASLGMVSDTDVAGAVVMFELDAVQPGTYFLDLGVRVAYYMTLDTQTQTDFEMVSYIANGDLVIEEGSPVDGATIRGSFSGELLVPVSGL